MAKKEAPYPDVVTIWVNNANSTLGSGTGTAWTESTSGL